MQTATTGIEALNAVMTFNPEVLLLDMQMPGLSGLNVLDELRRAGVTLPVILIAARPPNAREGFFATFKKPFKLEAIARTVGAAVRLRRRTSIAYS